MDREPQQELFTKLNEVKKEIRDLRTHLNSVNLQKEMFFKEKSTISKKIRGMLVQTKEHRSHRNQLTNKVKELKSQRQDAQESVKSKITDIQKTQQPSHQEKRYQNPAQLKTKIDEIEVQLETEAMPFEAEKKLRKKVKDLQKEYARVKEQHEQFKKNQSIKKDLQSHKKERDSIHKQVQTTAKESQDAHESLISLSKDIDILKPKEKEALKKYLTLKKEYHKANTQLKKKLTEMSAIAAQLDMFKIKETQRETITHQGLMKDKEKEIEQKMRQGKKITTEDLLIFQQNPTVSKRKR